MPFSKNDRVCHPKFGLGTIIDIDTDNDRVDVHFDGIAVITFLLSLTIPQASQPIIILTSIFLVPYNLNMIWTFIKTFISLAAIAYFGSPIIFPFFTFFSHF